MPQALEIMENKLKLCKELIKTLALEQKSLKKSRKTGPYKVDWDFMKKPVPEVVHKSWIANSKVQCNRTTITAALNLYHELRGTEYRHNVANHCSYFYKKELARLKELVEGEKVGK